MPPMCLLCSECRLILPVAVVGSGLLPCHLALLSLRHQIGRLARRLLGLSRRCCPDPIWIGPPSSRSERGRRALASPVLPPTTEVRRGCGLLDRERDRVEVGGSASLRSTTAASDTPSGRRSPTPSHPAGDLHRLPNEDRRLPLLRASHGPKL